MLPASDYLDPAVPVRRVEEAVAEDWRRLARCEFRLALGLRRLYRDYAHRRDGRGRFADWAEDRFGVPAKLASTFSFLGEHFERLGIGYDPRRRRAPGAEPKPEAEGPESPHVGAGKKGREKATGEGRGVA